MLTLPYQNDQLTLEAALNLLLASYELEDRLWCYQPTTLLSNFSRLQELTAPVTLTLNGQGVGTLQVTASTESAVTRLWQVHPASVWNVTDQPDC